MQSDRSSAAAGEWQRLHPWSLLFRLVGVARAMLIPAVLALMVAAGNEHEWERWLFVPFIVIMMIETIRFFTLRYRLADDELVTRQGILFRKERHVPFRRIQNVDLVQGVLHRLFKVADVNVQTAGGAEPEAVLKVLSLGAVEAMRERIFAGRTAQIAGASPATVDQSTSLPDGAASDSVAVSPHVASAAPAPAVIVHRLPVGELVKLGVISLRGLAPIAVLIGIAWEYGVLDRIEWEGWFREWWDTSWWAGWNLLIVGLGAVSVFVALLPLSIIWTIVRLHGWTLSRAGDDLRWSAGLFTRRTATVPRRRIQLVSVRRSWRHRLFKRASIRIETAAGARGENAEETGATMTQRWFIPLVRDEDVPRILSEIHPVTALDSAPWQQLPLRARRRMIASNLLMATLVAAVLLLFFRPWGGLALLALAPYGVWHACRHVRLMGFARTQRGLAFRSGVWTRITTEVAFDKVQTVAMRESPFDRRHRMATLVADTAGAGPADHRIVIRYLPLDVAEALRQDAFVHSARLAYRS